MENEGLIRSEFVYETAPFPSCHASTIVETGGGSLLCAFFGGTKEGAKDVCIWACRFDGEKWAPPEKVADGVQADGSQLPCWNPVLFTPKGGPLMLFYKVGPRPSTWWGMVRTSDNCGRTWSEPRKLPEHILGPVKNKPVQSADGAILSPTSIEGTKTGWRVYFERSEDGGKTWEATPYVEREDDSINAIQPSILVHSPTRLQALGRTKSKRMFETWSEDAGRTWSPMRLMDLPNCNSGTDAVTLSDGRHVLVYNHSNVEKLRYPLNVAVSRDGRKWEAALVLETEPPGQYSYPAVIQASDGQVHVVYTWKRERIKHAILEPQQFRPGPLPTTMPTKA